MFFALSWTEAVRHRVETGVPKDDHPSRPGSRAAIRRRAGPSSASERPLPLSVGQRTLRTPPATYPSQGLLRMGADAIIETPVSTRSSTDSVVERNIVWGR